VTEALVLVAALWNVHAHEFRYPMISRHGIWYRLDFCRRWENECGAPAAEAFCREKGYSHLHAWTPDMQVSKTGVRTAIISQPGVICPTYQPGHNCDSFKSVTCGNEPLDGATTPASAGGAARVVVTPQRVESKEVLPPTFISPRRKPRPKPSPTPAPAAEQAPGPIRTTILPPDLL
jgi:hypothetical protein